jgi:outer membrane protease
MDVILGQRSARSVDLRVASSASSLFLMGLQARESLDQAGDATRKNPLLSWGSDSAAEVQMHLAFAKHEFFDINP